MAVEDYVDKAESKLTKSALITGIDIVGATVLGPLWGIKDLVKCCYSSAKQACYYDFLYGIYQKTERGKIKDKDVEKFAKTLEKEEYFDNISNIIDSMFFSKCKIARNILGWITMKYLIEETLDYEDLILINGLKDVFDFEIDKFKKYAQIADNGPDRERDLGLVFIREYDSKDRIFISKFINICFFGNDLVSNRLGGGNYPLKYVKTNVTYRLMEYLEIFSNVK